MAQVEAAALRSQSLLHNERNTAIITLTEQLVRALHGGRVTSCKSAKDRTSMAVTAEQVRWLVERHGLDADEAPALVDEMRSRGCRWQNMRKNVSKGTYASTGSSSGCCCRSTARRSAPYRQLGRYGGVMRSLRVDENKRSFT